VNFNQRFLSFTRQQNSLLCVGLDPDPKRFPQTLKRDADPLLKFCTEIIDCTKHAAAAFKLNFAFFEAEGSRGYAVLEKLMQIIPPNVLTIADAKRGDIGNSSDMYARSILQRLNFDAVTVNPYMGSDAVAPFLQWPEKGAFILCLTSNPGTRDFQYFSDGQKKLYEKVTENVTGWNGNQNCGLVVGATQPGELEKVRTAAPGLPFLIPGVGAQGADLETAVRNGTDPAGELALFNVSRGILYQSAGDDFAEKAGREAEKIKDQINDIRKAKINAAAN